MDQFIVEALISVHVKKYFKCILQIGRAIDFFLREKNSQNAIKRLQLKMDIEL